MSRESDHRLMNGFQMDSSLHSMQSREARDAEAAEKLKIAANRVATIGSVLLSHRAEKTMAWRAAIAATRAKVPAP